ncbi:hypothetical protein [Mesorhizobium sp. M1365]|uniref:hypothetical protein n=1 Tax=Mesorhizobium sp. M1365 TaxID=2957090 RepID=UPI003334DB3B
MKFATETGDCRFESRASFGYLGPVFLESSQLARKLAWAASPRRETDGKRLDLDLAASAEVSKKNCAAARPHTALPSSKAGTPSKLDLPGPSPAVASYRKSVERGFAISLDRNGQNIESDFLILKDDIQPEREPL